MRYHNPHQKNGTITTQVVCAVLFIGFTFCWLFYFQADMLAIAQHLLSGGETSYHPLIGALIITSVLMMLQRPVLKQTKLRLISHALTYLPSFLLLAMLTSLTPGSEKMLSVHWLWIVPVVLLAWGLLVWWSKHVSFNPLKEPTHLFSRCVWQNALLMAVQMLGVALMGNTNAVFRYRAHAECSLVHGNIVEALQTGDRSLETDVHLTMMRVYALSKKGELADRLFRYPLVGTSADMLPATEDSHARLLFFSADSIWRHLGARPASPMTTHRFLTLLERDSLATPAVADYRLCGCLLDKDLDGFARLLPRYYANTDSLPQHYREALTLYTHLRSHPLLVSNDTVMNEDWADFSSMYDSYSDPNERRSKVAEHYLGSYWYYYYFKK